jgi:hypothetical protein
MEDNILIKEKRDVDVGESLTSLIDKHGEEALNFAFEKWREVLVSKHKIDIFDSHKIINEVYSQYGRNSHKALKENVIPNVISKYDKLKKGCMSTESKKT